MADDTQNHAYPAEVAGAIIKVMKGLGTLAKDNENKFDHYNYASIDDFLKHVRGHCAEAGLFFVPHEAREPELQEVTKKDGKPMVVWNSRFAFDIVHESGASHGPLYKTVVVQANGAQASGSAQSYALKQIMRGLFQIPTGDKDDPDKEALDISSKGEQQSDLQKTASTIRKKLRAAKDLAELGLNWNDNEVDLELIKASSDVAYGFLKKEYETRKTELENA